MDDAPGGVDDLPERLKGVPPHADGMKLFPRFDLFRHPCP
jgi:hypothetical protein